MVFLAARICFMGSKVPASAPRTASMAAMNPFTFCSISAGVHANMEESNSTWPEASSICMASRGYSVENICCSTPWDTTWPRIGESARMERTMLFRASARWPADGIPQSSIRFFNNACHVLPSYSIDRLSVYGVSYRIQRAMSMGFWKKGLQTG